MKDFKNWMDLYACTNAIKCRAFQLTLIDKARAWYHILKPNTINSFMEFGKLFLSRFLTKRKKLKILTHLLIL